MRTRIGEGGAGGLIERGGAINFPPLKRGGGLLEREGLIEDLRYCRLLTFLVSVLFFRI